MKGLIPSAKLFWKKRGSTVLTCVGAVGVIGTAVMAAKATPKAIKLIEMEERAKGSKLTVWEKVKTVGPAYIPTAMVCATTIGCMFGAQGMNKRSQVALMSLYTVADRSYKEYKEKVSEMYGEEANHKIMKAIANDHYTMDNNPAPRNGQAKFMDFHSLQIFDSTLETIETAEKIINNLLRTRGYVFLNEYYSTLGLPCIDEDYENGWSLANLQSNNIDWLEFIVEESRTEDGEGYYIISMSAPPIHNCQF